MEKNSKNTKNLKASFGQNIDLAKLTSDQGFIVNGIKKFDDTGYYVASAGDINKDGYADMLIGSDGDDKAYVIYGGSSLSNIELANLTLAQGVVINGAYDFYDTGASALSADDFNADGYNDIIISAISKAYVIYGGSNLRNINLVDLTAAQGFIISGINTGGGRVYSVASAGDINKDGYADMLVGPDDKSIGGVYLIYGGSNLRNINLSNLTLAKGFVINGVNKGYYTETYLASAGDINKDGYADMIIGANSYPDGDYIGRVCIIYGGSNLKNINLANLTSAQGFIINGINKYDYTGSSVASADVNQDGYYDIMFGAHGDDKAYVIYGASSLSNINLINLTPAQGFIINGINKYDYTGSSVASAGDINRDGYDDMLIGASGYSAVGRAYVIYGGSNLSNINLVNLTLAQGFSITGINEVDLTGGSVAGAGDVNGDGYPDVIVGAKGYPGAHFIGRAYVIYGGSNFATTVAPTFIPTKFPTYNPTVIPTMAPSGIPSLDPTQRPSGQPSVIPTTIPTNYPIDIEKDIPTAEPTYKPSFEVTEVPVKIIEISNGGVFNITGSRQNLIINSSYNVYISGGSGNNIYSLIPHPNVLITIKDFNISSDIINLKYFEIYNFLDLNLTYGSIIINLPKNQAMRLLDLVPSDISASNFLFDTASKAKHPTQTPTSSPTMHQTTNLLIHSENGNDELGAGQIAAIVIAGVVGGAMILVGGFCLYNKIMNVDTGTHSSEVIKEDRENVVAVDEIGAPELGCAGVIPDNPKDYP